MRLSLGSEPRTGRMQYTTKRLLIRHMALLPRIAYTRSGNAVVTVFREISHVHTSFMSHNTININRKSFTGNGLSVSREYLTLVVV